MREKFGNLKQEAENTVSQTIADLSDQETSRRFLVFARRKQFVPVESIRVAENRQQEFLEWKQSAAAGNQVLPFKNEWLVKRISTVAFSDKK